MVPDESVWPCVLIGDVLWAAYHRRVCVESDRFPPMTFLGDSVEGRWSGVARAPTTKHKNKHDHPPGPDTNDLAKQGYLHTRTPKNSIYDELLLRRPHGSSREGCRPKPSDTVPDHGYPKAVWE